MNIGIDGRFLYGPRTGLGRYICELCKEIDALMPDDRFFVYSSLPIEMPVVSRRWIPRVGKKSLIPLNRQFNLWLKTGCYKLCKEDDLDVFWATTTHGKTGTW